jgi:hypothetical protein
MAGAETGGIQDSIAAVINSLTGSSKTGAGLSAERVSEDLVFASIVHQQLASIHPEIAEKFLVAISKRYSRNLDHEKRQPLFEAVDGFLSKMVRDKTISAKEKKSLVSEAFGRAQLDNRKGKLSRRLTPLEGAGNPGDIQKVVERVSSNTAASQNVIKDFRTRLEERPEMKKNRIEFNKTVFEGIDKNLSKPAVDSPPTNAPSETDAPAPKASEHHVPTRPNDLVYKPQSERDGLPVLMLPIRFSHGEDIVFDVSIETREGKHLMDLVESGVGEDGRRYFRASEKLDYEGPVFLRLKFAGGGSATIDIDNPQEFYKEIF